MTVPQQNYVRGLTGRRFRVRYHIRGTEADAHSTSSIVANEQTVEFPDELVPAGDIRNQIIGRVEELVSGGQDRWRATISYEVGSAGTDLPQLINMLNGLTSFLPNLTAERVELPAELLKRFAGPAYGISGIREKLMVPDRPLLCTALKPMGLSPESLSTMAYEAALGGLDILKDDHGISDLPFAPFEERVPRLAEAVSEANGKTGFKCMFAANVTAAADRIVDRALFAQQAGAGMLMVAPAIIGFDTMRMLAEDPRIELPILSHPTVSGGYVAGAGAPFSFYLYYGQMHRLAGADAVIYANYGGRFPVSVEDSHGAVSGCRDEFGGLRRSLPMIGGGMSVERGRELREEFGVDSGFLVGGKLHSREENLTERVRRFVETVS
ncbi:MAG: RuBisCO large subunit C-terminal-like domain-containing protein [Spirochaetia bacterium]